MKKLEVVDQQEEDFLVQMIMKISSQDQYQLEKQDLLVKQKKLHHKLRLRLKIPLSNLRTTILENQLEEKEAKIQKDLQQKLIKHLLLKKKNKINKKKMFLNKLIPISKMNKRIKEQMKIWIWEMKKM